MRVLSYNILAPSYARPDRYPFTDPLLLAWEARRERLVSRIRTFEADVICLQEVEPYVYQYIGQALEMDGFQGVFAQKRQRRPDGSATFYRSELLELTSSRPWYFRDGLDAPDSGHLALETQFSFRERPVAVVNTHIRWDHPDARDREHLGFRQVSELAETCLAPLPCPYVLAGDFNARPSHDLIRLLVAKGLIDAYAGAPQPTDNSECSAKRIDYIFHTKPFRSEPVALPVIDDETPLPSETEPSDHLPIAATLTLH